MPAECDWKGHLAAQKVDVRAAEKKVISSEPKIPCRYDRILDIDGKLFRVQIKYAGGRAIHASGVTTASLASWGRQKNVKVYDEKEIDALLVYVPQIDAVLWFYPEQYVGKRELSICYAPAKNNQKKGCWMAQDFVW